MSASHQRPHLVFMGPHVVVAVHFTDTKERLRKVQSFAQGQTGRLYESQGLSPDSLTAGLVFFPSTALPVPTVTGSTLVRSKLTRFVPPPR